LLIAKFLYFALHGQFQFDAIYSMILYFASWSVYWQLSSLFTSRIGQLFTISLDWLMSEAFQCYQQK